METQKLQVEMSNRQAGYRFEMKMKAKDRDLGAISIQVKAEVKRRLKLAWEIVKWLLVKTVSKSLL